MTIQLAPQPQIDELVAAFRRAGPVMIEITEQTALELFDDQDPTGRPVCLHVVEETKP